MALSLKSPSAYLMQFVHSLPNSVDLKRFKAAWRTVAVHNPILRTRFVNDDAHGTLQVVVNEQIPWIEVDDQVPLESFLAEDLKNPLRLGQPMSRCAVWRRSCSDFPDHSGYHFVWTVHHSILDGWSLQLVLSRVQQAYDEKQPQNIFENTGSFNDEGIVEFATDNIKVGAKTYSVCEYCARIAGLLAGLSMTESATYQVLPEVDGIAESETPDDDIDSGKLILINDGEKVKIARGVNSLHILSGDKTADMKKIKIIEGMDLMRDDIRTTFENNYIGINNSYDNKIMFVAAVNQYFDSLVRQGVLYDEYENAADIDVNAQREWLAEKYDISEYTDDQIRKAKTGSFVFLIASVQFVDAIEDLRFAINME